MKRVLGVLVIVFVMGVLVGCNQKSEATEQADLTSLGLHGAVIAPPREIEPFTLPSTTGEDFRLSDYEGKVVLIYFGYLGCPDVCPTTMADLMRAYRGLGEPGHQVQVVFISVDPERDSLETIRRYMGAFHEDFIGLRGEVADVQPIMDQFGVEVTRHNWENSAIGYTLDHTASVFLVAPDGKLVEQIMFGTPYQDMLTDTRLVLAHYQIH